jgi:pyruvate,orthophosphate dikinase
MELVKFGKGIEYSQEADLSKDALGGKGAGLVEMSKLGIPVPPGFIVPTEASRTYAKLESSEKREAFVDGLMAKVLNHYDELTVGLDYAPLVSVRSGAPVSMPGMMDTILNVGLTMEALSFWKDKLGDKAALDCRRRLIQMLGSTAYGVPHEAFEKALSAAKKKAKVKADKDLSANDLSKVCTAYLQVFKAVVQQELPSTPEDQLRAAVVAVLESWNNERAKTYRQINNISDDMGTAVVVQVMAFGNMNDDSGSGVLFSRDSSTGANELNGEFLQNAQGEDVVAGIRTPLQLIKMKELWPEVLKQINETACVLEEHYKDMVDVEFTVQDKVLYILQCRVGKRSAVAAFQIAHDLATEKREDDNGNVLPPLITKAEALKRVSIEQFKITKRPVVDPKYKRKPDATGLFGSSGVATGKPVFSAQAAVECSEPCILVTEETDPDDIAGMNKAVGILTATGGQTSHAAVVARSMNKPCIVGVSGIVDLIKSKNVKKVTVDGNTGRMWFDAKVPVVDNTANPAVKKVVSWASDSATVYTYDYESLPNTLTKPHVLLVDPSKYFLNGSYILKYLRNAQNRHFITVDFRSVGSPSHDKDACLDALYNADEIDGVYENERYVFLRRLVALRKDENLKDITVAGVPAGWLKKAGYAPSNENTVKFISPEVDSVAELLDGGSVIVGDKLSKKLSLDDIAKMKALIEKTGGCLKIEPSKVSPPPAEYQFFKALGG